MAYTVQNKKTVSILKQFLILKQIYFYERCASIFLTKFDFG
jgi:hypothetical protein